MTANDPETRLFNFVRYMLYEPDKAILDSADFPESWADLIAGMKLLNQYIQENAAFVSALANGNLSCALPKPDNTIAAPAKALHGSLSHLTWQTERVAQGDYGQHVDYMGEFSVSFNTMVEQLAQRREALLQAQQELEQLAFFDALTDTYNRRSGMNRMRELASAGKQFTLAFVDIDYLKYCNDVYGHAEGNIYIKSVVEVLKTISGENFICRMGGDEFALIREGDDSGRLEQELERLRTQLRSGEGKYCRSFSYGICSSDGSMTTTQILETADRRMYEFKLKNKTGRAEINPGRV